MPLHPQAKAVIEKRAASGYPPAGSQDEIQVKRQRFNETWREPGPEVGKVEDRSIPGPNGDIPIRVYTPPAGSGPFPALMLFHGGGFVLGNINSYDGNARRLCVGASCVVVSVDYRVAPENKFPAAPEDCYAATVWVAENGAGLGVDSTKIATCGDSAGGNLATVVALMARDRGGPKLSLQIMRVPVTHRNFSPITIDREETPKSNKEWWWVQYLENESDAKNPYAAPMETEDLSGLPPALIVTAEYDELRDEGEAYAERLKQAGIPTTCTRYDGMFHVFQMYPGYIDVAKEALERECAALKEAFSR